MKAKESTEREKKGKGWKPIKNMNPVKKPLISKKKKESEKQ